MAAENMEPSKSSERLVLGFGLTFADLYVARALSGWMRVF
jgi:hypothetical protein